MWFQKDVVSVEYDNKTHEFEMYYCPLWDWALDLLRDSCLTPHFLPASQVNRAALEKWLLV